MTRIPLASLCALGLLLAACQGQDAPKSGNAPRVQTVSTTLSVQRSVPLVIETQGNVLALDEVDIRPQKNGTITAIHFREGEEIRRGQHLFSLDARDDDAAFNKANAGVASAEAAHSIAARELKRSEELAARNFIAPSALDNARSRLESAEAGLAQARAALEQARVTRSYNQIHAPFAGRAGLINVRPGSLVSSSATATALVRLTRMDPIGVSFSIAERELAGVQTAQARGALQLEAITQGGERLTGELIFIDSNVDRNSGTLLLKGRLANGARQIWPGQYVSVRLQAGMIENAVLLPAQAVINGPSGRFVYVVEADDTVRAQPVEQLRIVDQQALLRGIDASVKVVLEGAANLRPGARVRETAPAGSESRPRRGAGEARP